MNRNLRLATLTFFLLAGTASAQIDTLKICSYNILKFSENVDDNRLANFRVVLDAMKPDILIVQELISESAMQLFLNSVLNHTMPNQFASSSFIDGPDTDNAVFYRTDKIQLLSQKQIATDLRDISEFVLRANRVDFRLYSLHLKAGQGSSNEQRRYSETRSLREYLNTLDEDANFIVAGDFNIYSSTESAFQKLIGSEPDNDGRLFDPIGREGNWHNNQTYAAIHTQSPRTSSFGGGATGGLDDRFDLMLISGSIYNAQTGSNGDRIRYLSDTYSAFGNDGAHFDQAIITGTNNAVPPNVVNALHEASDHLPIFAKFEFDANKFSTSVIAMNTTPALFSLDQNYPNPFNPTTTIRFSLSQAANVHLGLYDLTGKEIDVLLSERKQAGDYSFSIDARGLASGVYIYRISVDGIPGKTKRMVVVK